MEFFRSAEKRLSEWRVSPYRKPLVIRGARQTGKTTLIKKFGKDFDTFIYLNLEVDSDRKLFENDLSVKDLLQYICLEKNIQRSGETLLFIDEIQYSARAVMLMRYFYEETPELFVISAGSLLEVIMEKFKISFPVGRVEYLYLFPMTFEEFLIALNEEQALAYFRQIPIPAFAHPKLSKLFRLYAFIGGMPEAVSRYAETRDLSALSPIYADLLTAFQDDSTKYAKTPRESEIIRHIIETAPKESGNRITFANFGNSAYKSLDISGSIHKLEHAMLLYLRYPVTNDEIPMIPDRKLKPRLHFFDSGLINYSLGIQAVYFENIPLADVQRGRLAEQMVWQELFARENYDLQNPTFWTREKKQSNAEIDFIISWHGRVFPIEVKSGKSGTLKSLHQYINSGKESFAIRLYDSIPSFNETQVPDNDRKPYRLLNLPVYCASKISDYLEYYQP